MTFTQTRMTRWLNKFIPSSTFCVALLRPSSITLRFPAVSADTRCLVQYNPVQCHTGQTSSSVLVKSLEDYAITLPHNSAESCCFVVWSKVFSNSANATPGDFL